MLMLHQLQLNIFDEVNFFIYYCEKIMMNEYNLKLALYRHSTTTVQRECRDSAIGIRMYDPKMKMINQESILSE